MTASIGMQVTGGLYQTRNRYERPGHVYPEWEVTRAHIITDDFFEWTRNTLPVYREQSYRYDAPEAHTGSLTPAVYPSFLPVQDINGEYRYDANEVLANTTLNSEGLDSLLVAVPTGIATYYRYDQPQQREASLGSEGLDSLLTTIPAGITSYYRYGATEVRVGTLLEQTLTGLIAQQPQPI